MKKLEEMIWSDFENMTESDAVYFLEDRQVVKGHQVYFIEAGGYFGLMALVFKNGHNIKYAADSELHHRGHSKTEVKKIILKGMERALFTDDEMLSGSAVVNYDTYQAVKHYIINYYVLRYNHISAFYISNGHTAEENRQREESLKGLVYNPYSFCYMSKEEASWCVNAQRQMMQATEAAWIEAQREDMNKLKNAFLQEMYNHEYGINWDPDRETLEAFGLPWNFKSDSVDDMLSYLKYNDDQKRAYYEARRECLNNFNY